jgi:hypothetical protein
MTSDRRSRIVRCFIFSVSLVVTFPLTLIAQLADAAKTEVYPLQTVTLTDQQFLTGVKDGKPAVIAGELRLPKIQEDRLPAMLIVHGSGGIMGNEDRWARELNSMGIATFAIDGFTGRGITNTGADQVRLERGLRR